jgi:hypothetical protein
MNNRERLMDIISENNLERRDVAELLSVKPDEVAHWLLPHDAKNHKEMPDMAIELLELKVVPKINADSGDNS